jgi:hypothetical protein
MRATEVPAAKTHLAWRREVADARRRHDYLAMLTAAQTAADLRPDSPRELLNLAGAYALTGHRDLAFSTLDRLAARCIYLPLAQVPDLASLRDSPEFAEVLAAMERNLAPRGSAQVLLDLPGVPGIIEGIAHRTVTKEFFFGDVHDRCVWRLRSDGSRTRFSSDVDSLLGVFKLVLDEAHGLLWVSTSALPEVAGFNPALKGRGELAALDLTTGRVVRRYPLPADGRDHCLGDFLLAPDGTVYLTDSVAPVIWRLVPGGSQLELFLESTAFISLQGIGLLPHRARLVVTDYAMGIALVDLGSREITWLQPALHATLLGLDSLAVQGDTILAVQNGIEPERVVRVLIPSDLSQPARLDVLAAAVPNFADLTHFVLFNGRLAVIAGSGWAGFQDAKNPPPPHTVRVMLVKLPR